MNKLHSEIRNEWSELVCFRLTDKICLELAKDRGMDIEAIKQLPDLHFMARNLDSGRELRGQIKL